MCFLGFYWVLIKILYCFELFVFFTYRWEKQPFCNIRNGHIHFGALKKETQKKRGSQTVLGLFNRFYLIGITSYRIIHSIIIDRAVVWTIKQINNCTQDAFFMFDFHTKLSGSIEKCACSVFFTNGMNKKLQISVDAHTYMLS